jgi:hypothetical protein
MKSVLAFVFVFLLSVPALADNVTIVRDPNTQVRNLPGNAQIVTGGRDTVVIQGDDDVWRTMLLGPRNRVYAPNYGGVNSTCPPTLSSRERNRCIRDMSKAQEKIRKKYND